tara:strand:+ start:1947 stop:3305 length:1359 start_codon:yes stop_codon:yes gene_type:complete
MKELIAVMKAPTISRNQTLSRRTVLRAAGTTLSLPFFEAMVPGSALAQSATATIPPRMAFLAYGIGMNMRQFFPDGEGPDAQMGRILRPLEPFRSQFTALSGTWLEHGGGHQGDYTILTGAPGKTPSGIVNSISADQVAAKHLGAETRFPSLQLSIRRGTGYGGSLATLSWNERGIPLAAENDPHVVFNRLFGVETARQQRDRDEAFRRRGSILDLVMGQAKKLETRVSGGDKEKLDEYLTSVREVESQLQRNVDWSEKPKPDVKLDGLGDYTRPYHSYTQGFEYATWMKLMYDLMALAFQTDSTRVITFMVRSEGGEIFDVHGVSKNFHALTHHGNDPRNLDELAKVDEINMGFFRGLLERLHSIQEPDGKSLLDRTMLTFTSGMGIDHSRDRLPTVLFGGSGLGIQHQTHLQLPDNTPCANVWRTMLDRGSVPVDDGFQDSTGVVRQLLA